MNIALLREFLLWCTLVNSGVLTLWFLVFRLGHNRLYALHVRWLQLAVQQFDAIHYSGMALYKVAILFGNVVPYVALRLLLR